MTAFDMTESIAPKSDQLNAEDLLTGPRTFTIAEVKRGTPEQPVDVHLVEFPGRPFKPSKTVRRIMVSAWGADASTYAGKRMTLYRDPAVKFGGMDVGGIRVSHMSGLDKPMTVVLAVSKGKRAPYVVKPLADEPEPQRRTGPLQAPLYPGQSLPDRATDAQAQAVSKALRENGVTDREAALAFIAQTVGRDVQSSKELTPDEAAKVIAALNPEPPAEVQS